MLLSKHLLIIAVGQNEEILEVHGVNQQSLPGSPQFFFICLRTWMERSLLSRCICVQGESWYMSIPACVCVSVCFCFSMWCMFEPKRRCACT